MSNTTMIIIVAFVVLIVLVAAAGIVVPLWSLRKKKKKTEVLMAIGKKGEATVLQLEDTGTRVNDNPRVNVLLEVRVPDHPPYQVRKIITVPLVRLAQIQEGSIVAIIADPSQPTNPDKVGILLR